MRLLNKIVDRVLFYLFCKHSYKRKFKEYGDNVRWGRDFERLCIPRSVRISCPELISIASNCSFDDGVFLQCHLEGGGIEIGEGVRLNAHTHVQAFSKISIGKRVLAAPFCLINSGVHGYSEKDKAIMDQEYLPSGEISVGEGTWLGRTAQILGNVKLARNVVVGAGSVVTKSFQVEGTLVGGVPAKVLRSNNDC